MIKINITPAKYANMIFKDDFKKYVLKTYKHVWHTLSDKTLNEALDNFNKLNPKINLKRFWN